MDPLLQPVLPRGGVPQKNCCPRCNVPLIEAIYEGVTILRCSDCSGVLVTEMDVLTIVGKREMKFTPRIAELGDVMLKQSAPLKRSPNDAIYDEKSIPCPFCLDSSPRMTRRFVNSKYPVEVDKCRICARVWFGSSMSARSNWPIAPLTVASLQVL